MPLTKVGEARKKDFEREYGKRLGENIFYAYQKKNPVKTKLWHKKKK